jgi:hypothetical protein
MRHELALRDIADVPAYVRTVMSTIAVDGDLREDAVQEGVRIVYEREKDLPPGVSLRQVVGGRVSAEGGSWLRCRLLNFVAQSQRQPFPVDEPPSGATAEDAEAEALRNHALRIFERREDVRDARVVARYLTEAGVLAGASHRPQGSAVSEEIWAAIEAERPAQVGLGSDRRFGFDNSL